jgi:hypothetical protein
MVQGGEDVTGENKLGADGFEAQVNAVFAMVPKFSGELIE